MRSELDVSAPTRQHPDWCTSSHGGEDDDHATTLYRSGAIRLEVTQCVEFVEGQVVRKPPLAQLFVNGNDVLLDVAERDCRDLTEAFQAATSWYAELV